MMAAIQQFCAKIGLNGVLLKFYSSSHNFQSLTVNPQFVRVPTSIFFTKKLT
ncbi:hypothetical protein LEP1GSC198_1691 [Leptospira kirschneri str. JB]|nr:hypothetical protein LEP1GSC198_1691 [Leptospira kirschneri str. JB]